MDGYIADLRYIGKENENIILDCALFFIVSKGFDGFSFKKLAEDTGYEVKSIKERFKDIEGIVEGILNRMNRTGREVTLSLLNVGLPPEKKLLMLIEVTLAGIEKNYGLKEEFAFMLLLKIREGFSDRVRDYIETPNFVVAKIVEEGQNKGDFVKGEPSLLASLFWAYFQSICMKSIHDKRFKIPNAESICHFLIL